jgi:cytochrome c553
VRSTASPIRSKWIFAVGVLLFSTEILSVDKAEPCFACHGASGTSQTPLTPSLGAQPGFFVVAQLFLFRGGRRDSEVMTAMTKDLTDDDLRSLSDRIEKLPPPKPPAEKADPARVKTAESLFKERNCAGCHGRKFEGNNNVPRLANQREDYLAKALKDYRDGKRIGYGNAQMPETVHGLDDAQLGDLAHTLATFQ